MEHFDLIVIGGGISGLSLAYAAVTESADSAQGMSPKRKVVVLEAHQHPGGAIKSTRLDDNFWMEMGTHTAYNSYGGLLEMMAARDVMGGLLAREKVPWLFWENGTTQKITSKLHWLELARSIPQIFFTSKEGRSVEQYFTQVLGRKNFQEVLGPMVGAVTSQDASAFPAEMLFKKRPRRKDIQRSFTMTGGLQTITDALSKTPGVTFVSDCTVGEIRHKQGVYTVKSSDGRSFQAPALGLATQPAAGAKLLDSVFPAAALPLARMGQTMAETVGIVVKKTDTNLPPLAGLVGGDKRFYSVVSRDTVNHPEYRGFAFHFRPTDKTGEDKAKDDYITAVTGVPRAQWLHRETRSNPLPAPVLGHAGLTKTIDLAIANASLLVTGNYFSGLALEDCVSRSFSEIARLNSMEKDQ